MDFTKRRRQRFLTQAYLELELEFFNGEGLAGFLEAMAALDNDSHDRHRLSCAIADQVFQNFMLRYTAGDDLAALSDDLTYVVDAYVQAAMYASEHTNVAGTPPLQLTLLEDYERTLQLLGLCHLLHRGDQLPRLAELFDGAAAGKDLLYDALLAGGLAGRIEVDALCHDAPYRHLANGLRRATADESAADLVRYLECWYPAMASIAWYDSHLGMPDDVSGYFGYWAVEAAAVAYLLDLDDVRLRDYIVYPKDLVDFARMPP